jgi:hypothetical protein
LLIALWLYRLQPLPQIITPLTPMSKGAMP